jgi:hypothetical protein
MLLQAIEGELPVQTISFVEPAMIKRFYLASYGLIDYLIKIVDRAVGWFKSRTLSGLNFLCWPRLLKTRFGATPPRIETSVRLQFQPLFGKREPFETFEESST